MVSNSSSVQSAAQTAQRLLANSLEKTTKSAKKLAIGFKVNSAADGAAELQQIEKLTSQLNGAQAAFDGAQTGSNVLHIADGALSSSSELLVRARELTVQAANDTNGPEQRAAIQTELNGITEELDRISNTTSFNGKKLLDGSTGSFNVTTDADGGTIDVGGAFGDTSSGGLGVGGLDVSSSANAQTSLSAIDNALQTINDQRSVLGASQNRLESATNNLEVQSENVSAARARLRDTDYASEASKFSLFQVQNQAATAVLAQTRRFSTGLLALING